MQCNYIVTQNIIIMLSTKRSYKLEAFSFLAYLQAASKDVSLLNRLNKT